MPTNLDLEKERVKQIVSWILKNGSDSNFTYYPGTDGAFKTREKPKGEIRNGTYVLKAHYTDHGINGVSGSAKKGTHCIVLRGE